MASTCLGEWVDFQSLDSEEPMTGFVIDIASENKLCKVCVPMNNKTYTVRMRDMTPSPSSLRYGDAQALIDLSLETRDEKWFDELIHWEPKLPTKVHITFLCIFIPLASLFFVLV